LRSSGLHQRGNVNGGSTPRRAAARASIAYSHENRKPVETGHRGPSRGRRRRGGFDRAGRHHRDSEITILSNGPAFGGYSFAGVGTYTVIKGYALDAVNPTDPKNAMLTDINLAPRDANGNVDVLFNFYMIIPTNLANGNGRVMYEPPNRGGKTFGALNR
jgi:hypothetical protein